MSEAVDESIHCLYIGGSIKPQDRIKEYIIKNKSSNNQIPFKRIPKAVLYLAALELVNVKKAEFTTSFSEIQRLWNTESKHIIHDSIKNTSKKLNHFGN